MNLWKMMAAKREQLPVLSLALVAALLFLVTRLTSEVLEGDTLRFDSAILLALRRTGDPGQPIGPPWFTDGVVNVTSLGSNIVLGLFTAIVAGYLFISGRRAGAVLLVISAAGAGLLTLALKDLFMRPRPDIVARIVNAHSASFPSGHSLGSSAIYLTLSLMLARFEKRRPVRVYAIGIALLLTVVVGMSRIYLGVHWPTDVLAGWSIGSIWALACWTVSGSLQRRHYIEQ